MNNLQYVIMYCLRCDCREVLKLDITYNSYSDAIQASLDLESDPEVYTSWIEEVGEAEAAEDQEWGTMEKRLATMREG